MGFFMTPCWSMFWKNGVAPDGEAAGYARPNTPSKYLKKLVGKYPKKESFNLFSS